MKKSCNLKLSLVATTVLMITSVVSVGVANAENTRNSNVFEVKDTRSSANMLNSTFSDNNLEAKQHHHNNSGSQESNNTSIRQSSIASQALPAPAPEPETYSMLLAGLGLIGLSTRRRKNIR